MGLGSRVTVYVRIRVKVRARIRVSVGARIRVGFRGRNKAYVYADFIANLWVRVSFRFPCTFRNMEPLQFQILALGAIDV